MLKRPTRVERILLAQERVTLANDFLAKLPFTDPRFGDALNEYREALDHRKEVESSEH